MIAETIAITVAVTANPRITPYITSIGGISSWFDGIELGEKDAAMNATETWCVLKEVVYHT